MRAFVEAWPEPEIVQRVVAQLPWRQNIALIERLDDQETRLWYAEQTIRNGWSQPILYMQIEYALRNLNKPIGIAEWETRLVEKIPDDLKGSLPTVEEIEAELGGIDADEME